MRLVQKMLIGGCALTVAGAIGFGGVAIKNGAELDNLKNAKNQILETNGYSDANQEYKQQQIEKLVNDYNIGLISKKELKKKCYDENLLPLDVETFAHHNLSKEQLIAYENLKEEIGQTKLAKDNFSASAVVLLMLAVSTVLTILAIEPEEKAKK